MKRTENVEQKCILWWRTCGSPQISSRMMVSLSDHGTFLRSSWIPETDSKDKQQSTEKRDQIVHIKVYKIEYF